jgi:hypothetical protein
MTILVYTGEKEDVQDQTGIVSSLYSFAKGFEKKYMKMQYFSDIFVNLTIQRYLNHFCKRC